MRGTGTGGYHGDGDNGGLGGVTAGKAAVRSSALTDQLSRGLTPAATNPHGGGPDPADDVTVSFGGVKSGNSVTAIAWCFGTKRSAPAYRRGRFVGEPARSTQVVRPAPQSEPCGKWVSERVLAPRLRVPAPRC